MKNEIDGGDSKPIVAWLRRRFYVPAIILHLAIAAPLAYLLNIWMDEASTLHTTRNGFAQTLNNVFADERQAPLYFLILSLWRALGDSIFFARLFSILCGAAAIYFFYRLARRFTDEFAAAFLCFFFAIHPYLIWASVEIRVYSAVILISVLLLKFFAEGYLENAEEDVSRKDGAKTQRKAQIFYVTTAVIALYTNYYLGFTLVAGFAALLAARRWRNAKTYFTQMLVVGASLLPLAWIIKRQMATNTSGFTEEKSIAGGANILSNHVLNLAFPMDVSLNDELSALSVIRILFVCSSIAAVLLFLIKDKFRAAVGEKILVLGTIAMTTGAGLLAAYFLLGADFVAFRHVAVLFAPLILFTGVILTSVLPRRILIVFAVAFALLFPYSKIYKQYPNLAKRGDWARVAQFIEQNEKPNQPIVVFQNYDALALPFYYRGVNVILPDENFFAWNVEDSLTGENAFRNQIAFVVSKIPPGAQEIWLATEGVCQDEKQKAACRPLENFVEANYTIVETKDFYLERIRLLRKK